MPEVTYAQAEDLVTQIRAVLMATDGKDKLIDALFRSTAAVAPPTSDTPATLGQGVFDKLFSESLSQKSLWRRLNRALIDEAVSTKMQPRGSSGDELRLLGVYRDSLSAGQLKTRLTKLLEKLNPLAEKPDLPGLDT